jgi:pyrimidine-nucleoside phosphorylase/thymidine phosphorylase
MTPYELIRAKRDGRALPPEEIRTFLDGYTRGQVTDPQMAALCMAVWFRGLTPGELRAWTESMLRSGSVLDTRGLPGRKVDKHSTGGVGDKVSLCLAPLVAACGVVIPMISGRGLGHTGGTLDKLEAIPGFRVNLSLAEARSVLGSIGTCMLGATEEIVPADRKLYALRDVTATVDSIPLIAASILSKKLAEGLDGLVLDVKVGSGAFMKRPVDAELLARTLVDLAGDLGCPAVAWLTSMDAPLGRAVGNALELLEAVEVLRGGGPSDIRALTLRLGAEMLLLAECVRSVDEGEALLARAIADGRGLERFRDLVLAQKGDPGFLDSPERLPTAEGRTEVIAAADGYLSSIDTEAVGLAAVLLGAGRRVSTDRIDPSVGLTVLRTLGERVERGAPLVQVHHRPGQDVVEVVQRLEGAFHLSGKPLTRPPLFLKRLEGRS